MGLLGLGRVQADLEAIMGSRVDLVPAGDLKPAVRARASRDLVPLWPYRERQRLDDIQAAIDAIRSHLQRGDLSDGLIFDAVRIRLLEIGETVKAVPADLLDTQPAIPWGQITRMRDHLAHRYFDTAHAILQATVDDDLPELERAVRAMAETLLEEEQATQDASSEGATSEEELPDH
jgi:uncharacterized protein with HEPN domain